MRAEGLSSAAAGSQREPAAGVADRPRRRMRPPRLGRRRGPLELGLFAQLPLIFLVVLGWISTHAEHNDFRIFRSAGAALLHGRTPYVEPSAALLNASDKFVYPAPFALPFVPFAAMPLGVASLIFFCCSAVAMICALRILGVRDYRCYGVALVAAPTVGALATGAFGPFLVLLLAMAWRDRRRARSGVYLALVAAAKLFIWPILLWPLVLGRFRVFATAAATTAVLTACWVIAAPHQLSVYLQTVRLLNSVQRWKSYSPQSLLLAVGAPTIVATCVTVVLAVVGAAAVVLAARGEDADRRAFVVAIAVALLASPILWEHYLILLLVPTAVAEPRLGRLWAIGLLFWISPWMKAYGSEWRILVTLALGSGLALAAACRRPNSAAFVHEKGRLRLAPHAP